MVERKAMKILIMCLCLFFTSSAAAWDGELYFGKYINSTLRAKPGEQSEYSEWVGGVEVGHRLWMGTFLRPYFKLETLMDEYNGDTFHPSSIKYELGIRAEYKHGIYVDLSHLCWHPIDSGGDVEQYNLIKIGVKF